MKICSREKALSQWLEVAMHSGAFLLLWLTATSAGQAQDFTFTNINGTITITSYTGPGGNVAIPSTIDALPVTAIGTNAFSLIDPGHSIVELTSVTIPDSVTSIGDHAFYNSPYLSSINLGNGVTNIGNYAFAICRGLTSVNLPNSVTTIGDHAFDYCTELASVSIPSSVTSIGGWAFNTCTNLKSVSISNGVTTIGDHAFDSCIYLTSLTIPNSVISIGDSALYYCGSLNSVTIGSGVISIGSWAFFWCGLTNVTIPNNVTSIGDDAFAICRGLTNIAFQGNTPSLGGTNVFSGVPARIYYLPGTTGWGPTFGGLPTAIRTLPYPLILTSSPSFGVRSNQFGFTVSWATNLSVVVEASTDLASKNWTPLRTNALSNGVVNFTDPDWTNHPSRFYRIRLS